MTRVTTDKGTDIPPEDGSRAAFGRLEPVSPTYATVPIDEGFNWAEVAPEVEPGSWYLVAFRSTRKPSADEDKLIAHDDRALHEAKRSRGFVHYFSGAINERRECLSFCLWESRERAEAAARLPAHAEAIRLADEMYDSYVLEYHALTKRPGSDSLELVPLGSRDAR
jgi:hypothetical protein